MQYSGPPHQASLATEHTPRPTRKLLVGHHELQAVHAPARAVVDAVPRPRAEDDNVARSHCG